MRSSLPALLGLVLVGCSSRATPSARPADLVAHVRTMPAFASRLSSAQALVPRAGGFAVGGGFRVVGAPVVQIEAPAAADGAIRFVDEASQASLGVRALDLAAKKGQPVDGALVYQEVARDTDLVLHAVPSGIEELRVLRSSSAPHAFRWAVDRGRATVREGALELRDEHDAARVQSEPPFAVDARGERRAMSLRIVDGTVIAELDPRGLEYPVVVDPVWRTVVSVLPAPGGYYAYSWVPANAKTVLQLGGSNNSTDGTGFFDVPTEKWTLRPLTTSTRTYSSSIWIPSIAKALIVGGKTGGGTFQNTAVLYDYAATTPATELASTMSIGRTGNTLSLVTDGSSEKVLVAGGGTGSVSVDWFDPATSTFVARASMATARTNHAAVVLSSGKVLVTGGQVGTTGAYSTGEVYNPVANSWTPTATAMGVGRRNHTQSMLPDGRVLIVGGYDAAGAPTATTSLYDPIKNELSAGPSLGAARAEHTATPLSDGKILVAGGFGRPVGATTSDAAQATTEIYDPALGTFAPGPTMNAARYGHAAVPLSSGRVMVGTGGGSTLTEILWPDGTACTASSSACPFCVDGVCCDTACTDQCQACDLAGKKGVCSPVNGEAPHGARGTCAPFGVCVYNPATTTSACATSCASDAACATGSYCVSPGATGTCAPKKADGAGCSANNQCTSSFCVDGVCCKTSCAGQCESCAEPGSPGVCVKVDGVPRGTRAACAAPYACSAGACATSCTKDVECATGRVCEAGACVPKRADGSACTAANQCISNQCVDGTCCNTDCTSACFACDLPGKTGVCSAVPDGAAPHGKRTCTPYAVCGVGGACRTGCTSGADCVSGVCDSATKTCTPVPVDAGPADASPDGSATDSSVTDSSVTDSSGTDSSVGETAAADGGADLGVATSPAPDPGPKPTVGEFIKCTKGSECATGHCVEGVCCDSECTDKCRSCALLSNPGKCTLEPMGVDLKSECGPALSCLGTCNGSGQCIGAGNGTMCGRNRCTGPSSGVGPAFCPGPGGKCATDDAVPFECGPYVCEPAFGACASGCRTSGECANGFVCDVGAKTCVAAAAPEPDDGGCSLHGPGARARSDAALLLAACVAVLVGRRRRSCPFDGSAA